MVISSSSALRHRSAKPESRIARLLDALLAIDRPALPRRRGKAGINGDLSAVIEVSGESFGPEDRSELRPNATDTQQHRRRGRHCGLFRVELRIPLGLHSLDLLEQQFEPIEFSTNLGFEMLGQATAIASLKRIQPRPSIATSSHKGKAVRKAVKAAGARLLFLPKYSPDLHPIEQVFAKIKGLVRKAAPRTLDAISHAIAQALAAIKPAECKNYLAGAGYASA
jgi:hypothetical protein